MIEPVAIFAKKFIEAWVPELVMGRDLRSCGWGRHGFESHPKQKYFFYKLQEWVKLSQIFISYILLGIAIYPFLLFLKYQTPTKMPNKTKTTATIGRVMIKARLLAAFWPQLTSRFPFAQKQSIFPTEFKVQVWYEEAQSKLEKQVHFDSFTLNAQPAA